MRRQPQQSIPEHSTFCIIGLGLMGGSYAMGLSKQGHRVLAADANEDGLQWALQNGIVQQTAPAQEETAVAALLQKADYIILALYPKDILPWLQRYARHLPEGAVLTDLAGVKGGLVPQVEELVGDRVQYISTHPMAGREASGVRNADNSIFTGANYIVAPTPNTAETALQYAEALGRLLGFGNIIRLSVREHDEMIGYVSQLTHAIAVSLMDANDDPRLPSVTGDSFRDLTRIADINAELWSELFLENAQVLHGQIDTFIACLQQLNGYVAAGDKEGLERLFRQSTARRRQFGKKQPTDAT